VQDKSAPTADEIKNKVRAPGRSWARWVAIGIAVIGTAAGLYLWNQPKDTEVAYRTESVEKGDIVTRAAATGTLQPTRLVTVGAEISGRIQSVLVEENDQVKEGQVLATFDTTTLESQLQVARARLNSSSASIRSVQAQHSSTQTELQRTRTLVDRGVVAKAELDAMLTSEARSRADLDRARADSEQARANLAEMQLQMEKAVILSPIDGVVMTRTVEPGQTVASSLQAPELFVVAEDLSRMTLIVWVDEADVGVVQPGQTAEFEVSAWPGKKFEAVVDKMNLSPTKTDNVVTYAAMLTVDNSDGLLRPGMTANATIVTGTREGVLRVPNSALRFRPQVQSQQTGSPLVAAPRFRQWGGAGASTTSVGGRGTVYVLRAGRAEMVEVRTGRSDGRFTEIIEGDLDVGNTIITGVRRAGEGEEPSRERASTETTEGKSAPANGNDASTRRKRPDAEAK